MLDDYLNALRDIGFMQLHEAGNLALGIIRFHFRIIFNLFVETEEGIVGDIILQHIKNKTFFDSLLHRINMKGFILSLLIYPAEKLQSSRFRRSGKGKHRHIRLLAVALDFIGNNIFNINICFHFTGAKRFRNRCHVLAGGRRMRFVDNYRKMLILQTFDAIHDVRELLNRRSNNLGVTAKRIGKVSRIALIIHNANKAFLVLNTKHCLLQLSVDYYAVSTDDDIIKDNLIVCTMQGRQTVRQPSNFIGFTAACTVLQKIVQAAAMLLNISKHLTQHIKLMIARKNNCFVLLHLAVGIFFFADLDKHELAKDFQQAVLLQDIVPHIMHAVFIFQHRITGTDLNTFTTAHIEGQEEGTAAAELGTHINLFQIHSEVYQRTGLPQKEAVFRITLHAILIDCILIGLSCGITFQLEGDNCKSVEKDYQVNAFIIARPNFFGNGEDVLMVQSVEFLVEGRCRFRIHQIKMDIGKLNAMLKHIKTTAVRPRFLLIDEGNKGIFGFFFIDFAQSLQLFRLSCFKESKQSLAVYSKKAVELRCRSFYVPAFRLYKLVDNIPLIFFFRKDVIHLQEPPSCR